MNQVLQLNREATPACSRQCSCCMAQIADTARSSVQLGTRGSALARWQTEHVGTLLQAAWPQRRFTTLVITTRGDQVLDTPLPLLGGKGLFTAELEAALHTRTIDLAVHSLKDLPTEPPAGLALGAIPCRVDPADVLISRRGYTLATLPRGATVGTSSRRRAAQLWHGRPDLKMIDIRGNIDTRVRKALDPDGPYDAIVLAYAGLHRLNHLSFVTEILALDAMLPAPGQGALGIQCRDEPKSQALVAPLAHWETEAAVTAERAFLAGLGGSCSVPIAAYASVEQRSLRLRGRVSALDGSNQIDVSATATLFADTAISAIARQLGHDLAQAALEQGAARLLEVLS